MGRAPSRIPTRNPIPSRFPTREERGKEGEGEREKERGAPLPLSYSDSKGGAASPSRPSSLSTKAHVGPSIPPGVPVTPRYSGKIPESLGTIPMSEYNLPIYEYLPLGHFETPRHVRDLIRDSEQHSVTKSHNSYNTISSTNVKRADSMGSRTM